MNHSGEKYFLDHLVENNKDQTIFDVGANVGAYTRKILERNPSANVHSFEPNPVAYEKLKQSTEGCDIKAVNLGMSDQEGELVLYDESSGGSSHASMYKGVIEDVHEGRSVEINIKLTTLDQYCKQNDIRNIDLLKIDTEGNELKVLKGARKLIEEKKIGVIQLEFNEMAVYSRYYLKDLIDSLEGYRPYRLVQNGGFLLEKYTPVYGEIFAYQNIVFVRKDLNLSWM